MADAKKKKSSKKYKGSSSKKAKKEAEIEAVGGHGGSVLALGIHSAGGSGGTLSGGNGEVPLVALVVLLVAQVLYSQLLVAVALVTQAVAVALGGAAAQAAQAESDVFPVSALPTVTVELGLQGRRRI